MPKESRVYIEGSSKVSELELDEVILKQEIATIKEQLTNPKDEALSIEQFLNLSKNAVLIIQSANAIKKDQIAKIMFLNLNLDRTKVLSWQLNPMFEELYKLRQMSSSRDGAIDLELLTGAILENWNQEDFDINITQSNTFLLRNEDFIY